MLEMYLWWHLGEQRVAAGEQAGETMLAIWDESVAEKSEALQWKVWARCVQARRCV